MNLRAEHVDDNAVSEDTADHEEDVEDTEEMVKHRVRFFITEPMRMDVRLVIGRRVPAVHLRLVPVPFINASTLSVNVLYLN